MSRLDNVSAVEVGAFTVPTDVPEADGTMAWDSTTMILVELHSESGARGLGYTYCSPAAALVVKNLKELVIGRPVRQIGAAWERMVRAVRNQGRPGIAACAISALDIALWDLRAQGEGMPLYQLLGSRRDSVPIYGSGGFTSYTERQLVDQLSSWAEQGISRVKMKIGTGWGQRPDVDLKRVLTARRAIGDKIALFVDANGAYSAKQAVRLAARFAEEAGVVYFEEPVSSDHREELAFVRAQVWV